MLRHKLALTLTLCVAMPMALRADSGLKEGTPDIKHAGPLAFAPHGVLLETHSMQPSMQSILVTTKLHQARSLSTLKGSMKKSQR
jgi:hypothetical protein